MDIHLNEYIEKVGTEEYKITEYLKGNRYKISNRYFEETYSGDNICKHVEMFNKLAAPDLCKIAYTSGFLNGRKFSSKIKNEIEKSKIIDYSHYKNVIKLEKNNR
jgi:hypothetical protein